MATVFDAFVQGPRAIDRTPGGLGLGLTLVKQLVELHGGRVTAHSEGEGLGSRFVVHWPKASGTRTTDRMAKLIKPDPMRVLVIDRDVEVSHAFARAIEGMGHGVVLVHDASDALAAGSGFPAEIVFVDLAVGGYDLAKRLRALPTLQSARIVTLGPHHAQDALQASDAGVVDHVTKPLDLVALATLLA
jgi:CheY-like chemotaxis protein